MGYLYFNSLSPRIIHQPHSFTPGLKHFSTNSSYTAFIVPGLVYQLVLLVVFLFKLFLFPSISHLFLVQTYLL